MADKSKDSSQSGGATIGRWIAVIVCFGILAFVLVDVAIRFTTPTTVSRLQFQSGVALPGVLTTANGQPLDQSLHEDRFDFQALDPSTGLLFIAHPGPSANKMKNILLPTHQIPAGEHIQTSVAVFNTRTNEFVGSILDAQFVHGIAVASNLHKVYVAGAGGYTANGTPVAADDRIYVIDESSCRPTPPDQNACRVIKTIKPTTTPDGDAYDPDHQEVFVSEPGLGLDVIDARTDQIVHTIKFNLDVGHVRYDPVSHHIFVVLVPTDTTKGEVAVIDPITLNSRRFTLPSTCDGPHGMILDSHQQVGFVACTNNNKVVMFDMRSLRAIGDVQNLQSVGITPDIVELDPGVHVLYVASKTAVTAFDESQASKGILRKLGDYVTGTGDPHSIAVNTANHDIYVPLTDVGGRPTLLIEQFNPQGNS
jgi:DNA-binding beta-propeller fold protein YncE